MRLLQKGPGRVAGVDLDAAVKEIYKKAEAVIRGYDVENMPHDQVMANVLALLVKAMIIEFYNTNNRDMELALHGAGQGLGSFLADAFISEEAIIKAVTETMKVAATVSLTEFAVNQGKDTKVIVEASSTLDDNRTPEPVKVVH